jgi:UDP-N-acetylglucosamine transferase subunit ALG13
MIFVTVATHEQQFNRLVEYVDNLKRDNVITEDVVIQTGFSTYEPRFCEWKKLYPYKQMIKYVDEARLVITHGGPSSFIMPLQIGKIPIVVPRQLRFDEHVNDHQLEFAKAVAERQHNIITVENIDDLKDIILNYDGLIKNMNAESEGNNAKFNERFSQIVDELFAEGGKKTGK